MSLKRTHQNILGRANIAPPDLPQPCSLCSLKRLELQVVSAIGRSVLFFTSLIKAAPQLHEFRIEYRKHLPYPEVSATEAVKFDHNNLKVLEMAGYVGCSSEEELLSQLFKIAPSLEMVVIDTKSEYYDDPELATLLGYISKYGRAVTEEIAATTRTESMERAKRLMSTFPQEMKFILK